MGWQEKLGLKQPSAKVKVEAELGKPPKKIAFKMGSRNVVLLLPPPPP